MYVDQQWKNELAERIRAIASAFADFLRDTSYTWQTDRLMQELGKGLLPKREPVPYKCLPDNGMAPSYDHSWLEGGVRMHAEVVVGAERKIVLVPMRQCTLCRRIESPRVYPCSISEEEYVRLLAGEVTREGA